MESVLEVQRRHLARQLKLKQEARSAAVKSAISGLQKLLPHVEETERIFNEAHDWIDRLGEITGDGEQPHLTPASGEVMEGEPVDADFDPMAPIVTDEPKEAEPSAYVALRSLPAGVVEGTPADAWDEGDGG